MALRIAGLTSHVIGTGFRGGFGADARGFTVLSWLRRNAASDVPRAGLCTAAGTSRALVNINSATALRGLVTDPASVTLAPGTAAPPAVGIWTPLALSIKDLGGTRRAVTAYNAGTAASGATISAAVTSTTFATTNHYLNSVALGREASAATAFPGDYGLLAVWDVALDDADLLDLMRGQHPLAMRRGNLQGCWPLEGDFRNLVPGGFRLTPNSDAPVWIDGPTRAQLRPAPSGKQAYLLRSGATAVIATASANQTLPGATQAATAASSATASAAQSLPAPTQAASVGSQATASASHLLPALAQVAAAGAIASAAANQALPALTQAASAVITATASAGQSLPALTQAATAASRSTASAIQLLPALAQAGGIATTVLATATASANQSILPLLSLGRIIARSPLVSAPPYRRLN